MVEANRVKKTPKFSINVLTNIILMLGLHEFDMYHKFSGTNKEFRQAIISCLPYQKVLLEEGRVSREMVDLMQLDTIYKRRFQKKLEALSDVLKDIEELGVKPA